MKDSWNPDQYEKFKQQRSQPFYDLMNLVLPRPGARVVDLGCGTGELTAELHQYVEASYTEGLDSSEEMLAKASAFESSNVNFKKSNIETWKDEIGFDVIFSNAALQWCSNHQQLFPQLVKSLRQNGQLAIQMPMNHDYPTHVIARELAATSKWKSLLGEVKSESVLPTEEYAKLLYKLGFSEQKVLMRVYDHVLPSREDVVEWVKGTMLTFYKKRLSDADYLRFVEEFRTALFAELPDDKPFFYPFKRVLMWARL